MAVSLVRGFGRILEIRFVDYFVGILIDGCVVEIFGDSLAMMLGDERPDHHRKLLLGGYGQSVGHVGDNLVGACLRPSPAWGLTPCWFSVKKIGLFIFPMSW